MNRTKSIFDPWLLLFASLATVMGLLFIFDAGYARSIGAEKGFVPPEFRSQIIALVPALLVCWGASKVSLDIWLKLSKPIWIVTLISLVLVLKFGHLMNGARRWIDVGPIPIQPAEFAKVATVLYLAGIFATRQPWTKPKPSKDWAQWMDRVFVPKFIRALPAVLVLLAVGLIEKEPDLGTGAVVAVIAFAMFIPGGVSKTSIAIALAFAVVGGWWMVRNEPYRMERIVNHVNRWSEKNVDDTGFQTVQAELAMASGGITGVGIGNGRAKQVIPAPTTDFIMATVGEEFGLLGAVAVMAVIAAVVWRILMLAAKAPSMFGGLILYGAAAWIGIQACVNVMMANALLPAIGIPLPFISSGGSSLLALWGMVGICQAAMQQSSPKPEPKAVVDTRRAAPRKKKKRLSRV